MSDAQSPGLELEIKTSQAGWLGRLAKAYQKQTPVVVVDDGNVGIDPSSDSLLAMGRRAELGPRDWTAVAVALGVAATGAYLVVMAILDPEPFSKIGLALGAGTALVLGGGFSAIHVLTNVRPPRVHLSARGIEIAWD
jgi:hypothetical protein